MLSVAEPTPGLQSSIRMRAPQLAINPVPHLGWSTALRDVLSGVQMRGVVLLVGPVGVGKSTLLQRVMDSLLQMGRPAMIVCAGDPLPPRHVVTLIDDAHLLGHAELETILRRPSACVLTFPDNIDALKVRHKRHITIVSLRPVAATETCAFIDSWLTQSGDLPGLISPAIAAAVSQHTGGRPGQIQAVTRLAVFLARLEAADALQPYHVAQAAETLDRVGVDAPEADDFDNAEPIDKPAEQPGHVAARPASRWRLAIPIMLCGSLVLLASISPAWAPAPGSVVIASTPAPPTNLLQAPVLPVEGATNTPVSAPVIETAPALLATPLRVTLLVAAGDRRALARGVALAGMLREHGYTVDDPQPLAIHLPTAELHYFSPPASPEIMELSTLLGKTVPVLRKADVGTVTPAQTRMVEILIPSYVPSRVQRRGG